MNLTLSTSVLNLVNVNTYETYLAPSYDSLNDDIENCVNTEVITDEQGKAVFNEVYNAFSFTKYCKELGECALNTIKDLDFSFLPFPMKLNGKGEMYSPREYNFTGDSLDFEVVVPDNIAEILLEWVKIDFDPMYMKKNFGSYDGFCSFMPYTKEDMIEVLSEENHSKLSLALAMIVKQCIVKQNKEEDVILSDMDFYEEWREDCRNDVIDYAEGELPLYTAMIEKM